MTKILIDLATVQQALVTLENVNPSLVCEMAHHPKKDQHGVGQKCPLEIRHLETITAIKEVLAQQPRPVQEQSCFCHDGVSLQSVSGGAAPEGYLGKVTLLIDGVLVDYVKAQLEQEPVAWISQNAGLYHGKPHESIDALPLYLATPPHLCQCSASR